MDPLGANTGVGGLAALLESSVQREDKSEYGSQRKNLRLHLQNRFHIITTVTIPVDKQSLLLVAQETTGTKKNSWMDGAVPLLAVVGALGTGSAALVTRIARDTHVCG
jgi:hypothetical protein